MQKRQGKREKNKEKMRMLAGKKLLRWRYAKADVTHHGIKVMNGGKVLDTRLAKEWWDGKIAKIEAERRYNE